MLFCIFTTLKSLEKKTWKLACHVVELSFFMMVQIWVMSEMKHDDVTCDTMLLSVMSFDVVHDNRSVHLPWIGSHNNSIWPCCSLLFNNCVALFVGNRGGSRFRLAPFCANLPCQWSYWLQWCAWIDNTAATLALATQCLPSCCLFWCLLDWVLALEFHWKVRSSDLWLMFCEIGGWEQRHEIILGQMGRPCAVDLRTMMSLHALKVGLEMLTFQHTPVVTLDDFNVNIDLQN